jgi:hypothetical protein
MDKRSHWPFSVKNFPPSFNMPKLFEIDPSIIQVVYGDRFNGDPRYDPIAHLKSLREYMILIK